MSFIILLNEIFIHVFKCIYSGKAEIFWLIQRLNALYFSCKLPTKKKKGGGKAEGKTLFVLRRQNASSECNECLCLCAVKWGFMLTWIFLFGFYYHNKNKIQRYGLRIYSVLIYRPHLNGEWPVTQILQDDSSITFLLFL